MPWVLVAAVGFGLAAVGPAIAYVCHPDRAGTRTLSLRGAVEINSMRGTDVTLTVRRDSTCHRVGWDVSMGKRSGPISCATSLAAYSGPGLSASIEGGYVVVRNRGELLSRIWVGFSPLPLRAAVSGKRVFALTSPAPNGPARLLAYDLRSGLKAFDHPVPYSGSTLDVAAGVAIFATTGSGLYGLRLTDGTIGFMGPERSHDNPQIERAGVVYRDNLYPRRARAGITTVKFVPIAAVHKDLAAVGHTLRTPGTIRAFAMDGQRVSLALAGRGRSCDRILHWNIPWHYTSFITQPAQREATCPNGRTRVARAVSLALGGLGSAWVLRGPDGSKLVRENSVACVERVLAKGDIPLVAGDRGLIAYVRRTSSKWEIGTAGWRSKHAIASSRARLHGLSVDRNRVAVLRADGTVEIRSRWGSLLASVSVPGARSIALNGGELTVLSGSQTLEVFDVNSGRLEHLWRLPNGVRGPVDVHYGVAVLTKGGTVIGLRLATGRTATLAHAPRPVRAQIEGPGVAYRYNVGAHGFVGFVPLAKIERRLGRLS